MIRPADGARRRQPEYHVFQGLPGHEVHRSSGPADGALAERLPGETVPLRRQRVRTCVESCDEEVALGVCGRRRDRVRGIQLNRGVTLRCCASDRDTRTSDRFVGASAQHETFDTGLRRLLRWRGLLLLLQKYEQSSDRHQTHTRLQ